MDARLLYNFSGEKADLFIKALEVGEFKDPGLQSLASLKHVEFEISLDITAKSKRKKRERKGRVVDRSPVEVVEPLAGPSDLS
jgi:hypothetical protein